MTMSIGGMKILQRDISLIIQLNCNQKAMISSDSPILLLKRDIRVMKALATKSGWQC